MGSGQGEERDSHPIAHPWPMSHGNQAKPEPSSAHELTWSEIPSALKPKSPAYLKGDHDVHSIPHTPDVSLPQVPRHADLWELWGPEFTL